MIFITVGSQKFQFNRLLKEVDKLIEENVINEEVIAQIGVSTYIPKKYKYYNFLEQDKFKEYMDKCNLVITHAGTGAIITAIKKDKKVIAVPRLAKYGEHVDDHQIQIINEFKSLNLIEPVYEVNELENSINIARNKKYSKYVSNTERILDDIDNFIKESNI